MIWRIWLLLAIGCGGAAPRSTTPESEASDVDPRIRTMAADALECSVETLVLGVVGEGDSSTGETVPLIAAIGCGAIAEFYCDRDGCQQFGDRRSCTPSEDELVRPDEPVLRVHRRRHPSETSFEFDDAECFAAQR